MSLVSDLRTVAYFKDLKITCICCRELVQHGGFYNGEQDIAICSNCIDHDEFRPLGIILGDAILDKYKRGHPVDDIYTNILVKSVLKRLESAIYRVIADGLFNKYVRRAS